MKWGIVNSAKVHKVKGRKNLTVMIMTDPTKNGFTLRIPKWVRFPVLIIPVLLILGAMSAYSHIIQLESQLVAQMAESKSGEYTIIEKDNQISELEQSNTERYEQLEGLAAMTLALQEQLSELESYKETIDEKLGSTDKTTDTQPTRRGSGTDDEPPSLSDVTPVINDLSLTSSALASFEDGAIAASGEIDNDAILETAKDEFSDEVDRLLSEINLAMNDIDTEKDQYEEREEQVDEILPYWDAYPSVIPVADTYVTSPYGYRRNPFGGGFEFHSGVDFKAHYQDIWATGSGTVTYAGYNNGYGYMVIIDHGYGILTKYAHCSKLYVEEGDRVERFDVIAKSGNSGRSSGPHLHYEVILDGETQDPMDYIYEGDN